MIAVFPFCGMMVFVANEGRLLFMKRYEMDLCTGALWKKILLFSVPLMFTNLLQVVFNMSDVAVVGKFAGSLALGSVGSTSILVTMFTGILIGMASGVNALTALYIGAKNDRNVRETVHTALYFMPQLRASDSPVWFHVRQTYSHDDEYEAGADRRCCPIPADLCFWYASAGTL